ncbi:hypothetical protein FOL46_000502 [Perkinsus olseni]|uniref:Uncharacterized protein n=1 Tax=Perkinsus olseni TaxID=32597 RepID=A0A7J6MIR3_PEROL|nr:hypothetical protein FOL46_000502 [Perkinsus olseni]
MPGTWRSPPGLLTNDTWFDIGYEFAWTELRVQLRLNGVALTNLTLDAARAPIQQAVGLNAAHWVAWQEPWSSSSAGGAIRARKHTITLQPGMWTQLVAEAPWVARTQAAVTAMRDGTVMLFGGEGDERLNDVWRWIPFTCAYPHSNTSGLGLHASPAVEDAAEIENQYLAQFEVECNAVISANRTCRPSIQGQWVSVSAAAPFSARSGATAVELKDGSVLLFGGFDGAFTNDIWRWSAGSSSPQICTTAWKGTWEQISAAAPWDPRYGMSSINLYSPGQWDSDAVVVFGGFGKASKSSETLIVGRGVSVQLSGSKTLFNDVWYHAAFTKLSNDSFVVLGGYDENTRPTADVLDDLMGNSAELAEHLLKNSVSLNESSSTTCGLPIDFIRYTLEDVYNNILHPSKRDIVTDAFMRQAVEDPKKKSKYHITLELLHYSLIGLRAAVDLLLEMSRHNLTESPTRECILLTDNMSPVLINIRRHAVHIREAYRLLRSVCLQGSDQSTSIPHEELGLGATETTGSDSIGEPSGLTLISTGDLREFWLASFGSDAFAVAAPIFINAFRKWYKVDIEPTAIRDFLALLCGDSTVGGEHVLEECSVSIADLAPLCSTCGLWQLFSLVNIWYDHACEYIIEEASSILAGRAEQPLGVGELRRYSLKDCASAVKEKSSCIELRGLGFRQMISDKGLMVTLLSCGLRMCVSSASGTRLRPPTLQPDTSTHDGTSPDHDDPSSTIEVVYPSRSAIAEIVKSKVFLPKAEGNRLHCAYEVISAMRERKEEEQEHRRLLRGAERSLAILKGRLDEAEEALCHDNEATQIELISWLLHDKEVSDGAMTRLLREHEKMRKSWAADEAAHQLERCAKDKAFAEECMVLLIERSWLSEVEGLSRIRFESNKLEFILMKIEEKLVEKRKAQQAADALLAEQINTKERLLAKLTSTLAYRTQELLNVKSECVSVQSVLADIREVGELADAKNSLREQIHRAENRLASLQERHRQEKLRKWAPSG